MFNRKNKAVCVLLLSVALYFAVRPYQADFWGGLLASGCLAALIGGLADWFAIAALFKRPLGIPWRTDIIKRNRRRLFDEIVRFTADDLLNVENISRILRRYQMAELLLAFLENSKGKEKLNAILQTAFEDMTERLTEETIEICAAPALKAAGTEISVQTLYFRLLAIIKEKRYDEQMIGYLMEMLLAFVRGEEIKQMLVVFIETFKRAYEGDSSRRRVMGFLLHFSSERLADIIWEEIINYLVLLKDSEHVQRKAFRLWLYKKAEEQAVIERLQRWQEEFLTAENIIPYMKRQYCGDGRAWMDLFTVRAQRMVADKIKDLKTDEKIKSALDSKAKGWLESFLVQHHGFVRGMIEARLMSFSDDELVAFIEHKIADDLQMIRINGSLVGALAGMALYVITFVVERACLQ